MEREHKNDSFLETFWLKIGMSQPFFSSQYVKSGQSVIFLPTVT